MQVIEGVPETLEYLSLRHDLTLFTKGNAEEQKLKLDRSGLGIYFGHTAIVKEKDPQSYRALIDERGLDSSQTREGDGGAIVSVKALGLNHAGAGNGIAGLVAVLCGVLVAADELLLRRGAGGCHQSDCEGENEDGEAGLHGGLLVLRG